MFAQLVFDAKTFVAQGSVRKADRQMRSNEYLDVRRLEGLQLEKAMAMARHAYSRTSFYRRKYKEAGFSERDLQLAENFVHLPIVEKQDIRQAEEEFLTEGTKRRNRLPSTTGGSTGEPLRVYHDKSSPVAAMWWRAYRWWGISPADNSAHIRRQSRTSREKLLHQIEWWPTREILLDARKIDPEAMHAFVNQWNTVRPLLLNGYVDGVHEFAQFVVNEKIELAAPNAIAVTASILRDTQRSFIEAALRAPVYDCYRSAEIPWIAAQCAERDGLHVMADIRLVEVLGDDGGRVDDGVSGEVVVSDLCNRVFPLVRYRMGDRTSARVKNCSCGRSLPLIDAIDGRLVDILRSPSGRMITGGMSTLFNRWPAAVRHFQLHQMSDYTITLRYVSGDSVEEAANAAHQVAQDLRLMLEDAIEVRTEAVDQIGHVGGKAKLVISDV